MCQQFINKWPQQEQKWRRRSEQIRTESWVFPNLSSSVVTLKKSRYRMLSTEGCQSAKNMAFPCEKFLGNMRQRWCSPGSVPAEGSWGCKSSEGHLCLSSMGAGIPIDGQTVSLGHHENSFHQTQSALSRGTSYCRLDDNITHTLYTYIQLICPNSLSHMSQIKMWRKMKF